MRKTITTLLLLATLGVSAQQQATLGYCAGEMNTKGALTADGKTWVSGAIYVPATMLSAYDGLDISTVRAAMVTKVNIDTVRVFVRQTLDGPNLSQATITGKTETKIKKGWNDVALEQPVRINAAEGGLYIGFAYHQKTAAGVFSAVGSQLDGGFFAKLGEASEWQDMSHLGILSVEGVVEGATQPDFDLGLTAASAAPHSDPATYRLTATVTNQGTQTVGGFTLQARYEQAADTWEQHFDEVLEPGGRATVSYTIPIRDRQEVGDIVMTITAIDADGPDAVAENNQMRARFGYKRKVLVEEFTTEPCGNCPRVARQLHDLLEQDKYGDNVIVVCHHAGYHTDWLTQTCDQDIVSFFGIAYAPAMMFDREPAFQTGINTYSPHTSPDLETMQTAFDYRLDQEPHAALAFTASYVADTRQLNVTVSGERNAVFAGDARLVVYLLEDSIKAVRQSGASDENYYHQHVIRAYNSSFGDVVEWDADNRFSRDYTFTLQKDWVYASMQLVAFIGSYNSADPNDCMIENAERLPLSDITSSGVAAVTHTQADGDAGCHAVYDLQGRHIYSTPNKGLYIRNGKKIFISK